MRFIKSKKGVALLVSLVVVGAAAFGAYAFLTASGSGAGASKVATASDWVLSQNGTGTCSTATAYCDSGTLWPGIADPLSTTYATNNNVGPLDLQTVTVTLQSISLAGGATDGTSATQCDESYFGFSQTTGTGWTIAGPSSPDPGGGAGGGGAGTTATYTYPPLTSVAAGGYETLPPLNVIVQESGASQNVCEGADIVLDTSVT